MEKAFERDGAGKKERERESVRNTETFRNGLEERKTYFSEEKTKEREKEREREINSLLERERKGDGER